MLNKQISDLLTVSARVGGNAITSAVDIIERSIAPVWLKFQPETPCLITFLFHSIFKDSKEIGQNLRDPMEYITVDAFRQFVDHFLENGYQFVQPELVGEKLDSSGKYALITFDDGYLNNYRILPILREYKVPAILYAASNHIKFNKSFWWDVIYRERKRQERSPIQIFREKRHMKTLRHDEIDFYLTKEFGNSALRPVGDDDRPMTPTELREFGNEKYISIGNHTCDHAILTNYSSDAIREQIMSAQNDIFEMTNIMPTSISYPNGNHSPEIISIAQELGLYNGITVDYRKNYLPVEGAELMSLGRIALSGKSNIIQQCQVLRSTLSLSHMLNNAKQRAVQKI